MTVRVLAEGAATGAANMERDAALARALDAGAIPPTVRIYGWAPPAVSIGYHQDPADFDRSSLARAGIDLVRRPTGGRAILHWHEVTYCAVLPLSFGSPRAIYRRVSEGLLAGIRLLGIDASLSGETADLKQAYASPGGIPCFSHSVGSEIEAGGRKLAGSAQRRVGTAVLQHGSFLLGRQHLLLAELISAGTQAGLAPGDLAGRLAARTADAESLLGRPVSFAEARDAVAEGFRTYFSAPAESADAQWSAEAHIEAPQ